MKARYFLFCLIINNPLPIISYSIQGTRLYRGHFPRSLGCPLNRRNLVPRFSLLLVSLVPQGQVGENPGNEVGIDFPLSYNSNMAPMLSGHTFSFCLVFSMLMSSGKSETMK